MAYIQEKVKGKKIVSFKFKTCLGRDDNGKQIFKCWTWYPPADLTPAKARKEADRVADRWEAEQRLPRLLFASRSILRYNSLKQIG